MVSTQGISRSSGLIIWVLCIIGQLSLIPYLYSLGILPPTSSMPIRFLLANSGAFAALFYGLLILCSSYILKRVELKPFGHYSLRSLANPAILYGVITGLTVTALDKLLWLAPFPVSISETFPSWPRLLACLYGAINEEVLCRLFIL
ncbi:hypothetical protein H0W26_06070, partial [Candidatus Dependentiae bacterium]|nr:hypothetical protein [Candidatus Dependentiae bacterium]